MMAKKHELHVDRILGHIQCTTVPRNTSSTSIFINFPQLAVATKTIPGERYMLFKWSREERGHNMMFCRNYEENMF